MPRAESQNIATRLKQNRQYILDRWTERVMTEVPAAWQQNQSTITDSLPKFLDDLEKALLSDNPSSQLFFLENNSAREHGQERARLRNYSLDHVVTEYEILRQVLFTFLESKSMMQPRERDILLHAIFLAVKAATTEFVRTKGTEFSEKASEVRHTSEKLQLANDKLRDERDLREQVMSLIAHDLRGPLTAAKMSAQMIVRRPERTDTTSKLAARVIEVMDRVDRMIQDLLDASRLRAGKELTLQFEKVKLTRVVREAYKEFSSIYGSRFVLKVPKTEVVIRGSHAELLRALENLISNAVKYGYSGTPITLGLSIDEDQVSIWVHNFGPQISPDEQANLFRPFSRTKDAEEHGVKGWGLGLTLVQGVARAHSGTATVKSSTEEGTTFSIRLPLR